MFARLSKSVFLALLFTCSLAHGEPPTVDDVLETYRANRQKLSTLHLRLKFQEEPTEALRKSHLQQAGAIEAAIKQIEQGGELPAYAAKTMTRRQFIEQMRRHVENTRAFAERPGIQKQLELFIHGNNYQVRTRKDWGEKSDEDWQFPQVPASGKNLPEAYDDIRIYSRLEARSPAAQIWTGRTNPNRSEAALLTDKHFWETQNLTFPLPPVALELPDREQHEIVKFFSAEPGNYRVVGTEQRNGRTLIVVDASIPSDVKVNEVDENGKVTERRIVQFYRGWIDLERGAIPVELKQWGATTDRKREDVVRASPHSVLTTKRIQRLENGAFYPAITVKEDYDLDPKVPRPKTREEWEAIQSGEKILPTVVHERDTWNCYFVKARIPDTEDFFVLKFPEGHPHYDLDTGTMLDALEPKDPVRAGQPAPPFQVARWLDGKEHSLEDFRGNVVLVDFWGLWCGACLGSTPALKELQEKYKDQPVVFISIHSAEYDKEALAKRIESYMQKQDWHYLTAIDSGTMTQNSRTTYAYGVQGFPTKVVIGADGIIKFTSAEPPKGLEDVFGKTVSESTEEDRARMRAFEKKLFEEAGVEFPENEEDIPREELIKRMRRVQVFHMSRHIDAALEDAGLIKK